MIEERPVAIRRRLQLLRETRHRRGVIAVEVRKPLDAVRGITVVRRAVPARAHSTVWEELALRICKRPPGEIATAEQRHHARDVGLEGQRGQVEVQLDMVVEVLRDAGRQRHFRHVVRRFRGDLEATFNLANFVRVLIDRPLVARAEGGLQSGELVAD